MPQILIALLLGAVAGAIDVLPMIKRVPIFSCLATFAQWILLGLVIPFVLWPDVPRWLTGTILGELGLLPFMILAYWKNRASIIPTAVAAAVLGTGIGLAGSYFIN